MKILAFDQKKKKQVLAGLYDKESNQFVKKVTMKHWMKCQQGFGISTEVFEHFDKLELKPDIVIYFGDEIRYVPYHLWRNKLMCNYNSGPQKFYRWEDMSLISSRQLEFFE